MSDHEFLGEYPPFAGLPDLPLELTARGFVTGNYVAEPGTYACRCGRGALTAPHVLKAGDRLPACPRCGPEARWYKV